MNKLKERYNKLLGDGLMLTLISCAVIIMASQAAAIRITEGPRKLTRRK